MILKLMRTDLNYPWPVEPDQHGMCFVDLAHVSTDIPAYIAQEQKQ